MFCHSNGRSLEPFVCLDLVFRTLAAILVSDVCLFMFQTRKLLYVLVGATSAVLPAVVEIRVVDRPHSHPLLPGFHTT